MADKLLEAVLDAASLEPPELPRLTVAGAFSAYNRLGSVLERTAEAYKKIPESTPVGCTDYLKEIVKNCEAMQKAATRLLEANK